MPNEIYYPNLKAEIARCGFTMKEIANSLGPSERATKERLNGKVEFRMNDVIAISSMFKPNLSIDYLFFQKPQITPHASNQFTN